jgi:hypothetical protein
VPGCRLTVVAYAEPRRALLLIRRLPHRGAVPLAPRPQVGVRRRRGRRGGGGGAARGAAKVAVAVRRPRAAAGQPWSLISQHQRRCRQSLWFCGAALSNPGGFRGRYTQGRASARGAAHEGGRARGQGLSGAARSERGSRLGSLVAGPGRGAGVVGAGARGHSSSCSGQWVPRLEKRGAGKGEGPGGPRLQNARRGTCVLEGPVARPCQGARRRGRRQHSSSYAQSTKHLTRAQGAGQKNESNKSKRRRQWQSNRREERSCVSRLRGASACGAPARARASAADLAPEAADAPAAPPPAAAACEGVGGCRAAGGRLSGRHAAAQGGWVTRSRGTLPSRPPLARGPRAQPLTVLPGGAAHAVADGARAAHAGAADLGVKGQARGERVSTIGTLCARTRTEQGPPPLPRPRTTHLACAAAGPAAAGHADGALVAARAHLLTGRDALAVLAAAVGRAAAAVAADGARGAADASEAARAWRACEAAPCAPLESREGPSNGGGAGPVLRMQGS